MPGDAVCQTTTPGECTLRAAIQETNAGGGGTINFNIGGGGAHVITPLTPLPDVAQPTNINGQSQPGTVFVPNIELSGINAGPGADGLRIISSGVNVQYLAVNGFGGDGFEVGGAGEASIVANFIGLATDEQSAAGNGGHGIHHASNSTGSSFIHANRIAFNGGDGIYVSSGFANINPQTIYLNDGLGIDLGPDGVTPNDPLDADSGPNNLQNFPVLTSAVISGSSPAVLTVDGTLHSSPNKFVLIDFFADADPCDPAVIEGRRPLGGSPLTTDSQGNASFSESIELVPDTVINSVTATTRVFPLYTSEFSPCVPVSGGPSPTPSPYALPVLHTYTHSDRHCHSYSHPDTDSNANGDGDALSRLHANSYTDGDGHCYADENGQPNPLVCADLPAVRHTQPLAFAVGQPVADGYSHANAHSYSFTNRDGNDHTGGDGHADPFRDADCQRDGITDCNSDARSRQRPRWLVKCRRGRHGTDPLDGCADNSADDAWPADINNDRFSDISDISALTGRFGEAVPPAPARYNIAPEMPDGFVDITDVSRMAGLFGQSCN